MGENTRVHKGYRILFVSTAKKNVLLSSRETSATIKDTHDLVYLRDPGLGRTEEK